MEAGRSVLEGGAVIGINEGIQAAAGDGDQEIDDKLEDVECDSDFDVCHEEVENAEVDTTEKINVRKKN